MKKLRLLILIPVLLAAAYVAGPEVYFDEPDAPVPEIDLTGEALAEYVSQKEEGIKNLKKDNQARIIWHNDSLKEKTEYAVVYLHGFSASQGEGSPVHINFARRYGCNLYLSRLHDHGLHTKDALLDMTPQKLVNSAAEAVAIGRQLGEKVILMSTSTGGTLSLYLAAHNPWIHSLILYSPNIRINNPTIFLLTKPWGLQIGQLMTGGNYVVNEPESVADSLYWSNTYRLEAVAFLQDLVEKTMKEETYRKVTQPVFMAYYYKNKEEQDPTVRVDAMMDMFSELGTPDDRKVKQAFPEAGKHVIASEFKSEDWEGVQEATWQFAEEVLEMRPAE